MNIRIWIARHILRLDNTWRPKVNIKSIEIKVTADTSQAMKVLDELKLHAERTKSAIAAVVGA